MSATFFSIRVYINFSIMRDTSVLYNNDFSYPKAMWHAHSTCKLIVPLKLSVLSGTY